MKHDRLLGPALLVMLALQGCDSSTAPAAATRPATPTAAPTAATTTATTALPTAPLTAPPTPALPAVPSGANDALAARTREVVNPDDTTMVFLYLDLAGLKPPIDEWVEKDGRVQFAPGADKAARRETVRAELEAGIAAARGIGRIRLSMANAQLSDYDRTYGEFTVGALSPASTLNFSALGQKVVTRFANGQTAQLWRVPADQAQAVRDKVGNRPVGLDVLLQVVGVQPGPGGGAIVTRVEEYALRASDGSTVARVR